MARSYAEVSTSWTMNRNKKPKNIRKNMPKKTFCIDKSKPFQIANSMHRNIVVFCKMALFSSIYCICNHRYYVGTEHCSVHLKVRPVAITWTGHCPVPTNILSPYSNNLYCRMMSHTFKYRFCGTLLDKTKPIPYNAMITTLVQPKNRPISVLESLFSYGHDSSWVAAP